MRLVGLLCLWLWMLELKGFPYFWLPLIILKLLNCFRVNFDVGDISLLVYWLVGF